MSEQSKPPLEELSITECVNRICSFFTEHRQMSDELLLAKEEYFRRTGLIRETDADFSNRMNAFLLWFVFDWKLTTIRCSPLSVYLEELEKKQKMDEYQFLKEQKEKHVHSLFQFVRITRKDLCYIKDLYSGKKYFIQDTRSMLGVDKGTYFETRIFFQGDEPYFANYFLFHPLNVRRGIRKVVKLIKKREEPIEPFLLDLHLSHTKWSKYSGIDIKSIYHFDNSVPEAK